MVGADGEQCEIPVAQAECAEGLHVGALRDRAGYLRTLALYPCGTPTADLLHFLGQAIDVLAREHSAAGDDDAAQARVLPFQLLTHRVANDLPIGPGPPAEVLDLEIEPQVGLVGAVALHRFLPRQSLEWRSDAEARLVKQRDQHGLDYCEHVVLRDERRLDVDLRELGLPVEAQILVAKAPRQLKVAVESGDHEQLFVDLW